MYITIIYISLNPTVLDRYGVYQIGEDQAISRITCPAGSAQASDGASPPNRRQSNRLHLGLGFSTALR